MPNYSSVRTAKAQPVGSAVPWVGSLTSIPPGWLVCNGQELTASEYPLLRRVIKNTYGGNSAGDFPNYTGQFKLPNPNQKGMADIYIDYFSVPDNGPLTPGADQPQFGIDNADALDVVGIYIGPEGDVCVPGIEFAQTDLNFSFTPDPDGTLQSAEIVSGTAEVSGGILFFGNVPVEPDPAQVPPTSGIDATFNVIKDIDGTYQIARREKGEGYEVDDLLIIRGNLVGGTTPGNDIFIRVTQIGNPFFTGTIDRDGEGNPLEFVPGFGIDTINIVGRKLGREHLPPHAHLGSYSTINKNDASTQPGRGVGIWSNPEVTVTEYWYGTVDQDGAGACPFVGFVYDSDEVNVGFEWNDSRDTGEVTGIQNPFSSGVGRYSLGGVEGTAPARTHTAIRTAAQSHGIGKPWFEGIVYKLRDADGNVSSDRGIDPGTPAKGTLDNLKKFGRFDVQSKLPFSDASSQVNSINYDLGPADPIDGSDNVVNPTEVLFNNAANSFTRVTPVEITTKDTIDAHDHQGEINITFDNGSLNIPGLVSVNVSANIVPDNVPNAFQLQISANSPTVTCLTLIRAY